MNLLTKQKQTHRCRKQTYGYQMGRCGGINQEIGIKIYILLYIKQITNKTLLWGFLGGNSDKESVCQCKRHKRQGFDPWVQKIPWTRKWQSPPILLPGKSHGQRSLAGCSQWGHMTELLRTHTHTGIYGIAQGTILNVLQ